jgi:hypothetical protein
MADEKKDTEKKTGKAPAKKASGAKKTPQKSKAAAAKPATPAKKAPPPEEKIVKETVSQGATGQAATKAKGPGSGRKDSKYSLSAILTLAGIILLLGFLLVYMNISRISKAGIEQLASNALGVPVTIEEMVVEPKDLRVTVSGLKIANPEGYETPYAMETQQILIEGESFSKKKLVFNKMSFTGTTVYLSVNDQTSNLSELEENLPEEEPSATEEKAEAPGPKIVVHDLSIRDAKLVPSESLKELGVKEVRLPPIQGAIGEQEDGVSPERAMTEVTGIIMEVATKRAVRAGIMKGLTEDTQESIADKLGIKPEAVESIKEGLMGLFE